MTMGYEPDLIALLAQAAGAGMQSPWLDPLTELLRGQQLHQGGGGYPVTGSGTNQPNWATTNQFANTGSGGTGGGVSSLQARNDAIQKEIAAMQIAAQKEIAAMQIGMQREQLALQRELGLGQQGLDARQMLSTRATRQLTAPGGGNAIPSTVPSASTRGRTGGVGGMSFASSGGSGGSAFG